MMLVSSILFHLSDVCHSDVCLEEAKSFKSIMNLTVDPCENFHQFSCGEFLKNIDDRELVEKHVVDIVNDEIQETSSNNQFQ